MSAFDFAFPTFRLLIWRLCPQLLFLLLFSFSFRVLSTSHLHLWVFLTLQLPVIMQLLFSFFPMLVVIRHVHYLIKRNSDCAALPGHATIFIYKCPVVPRKHLYINAHPTGVRPSYAIMTTRLQGFASTTFGISVPFHFWMDCPKLLLL